MNVDKKPVTFMILAVLAILVGTLITTFIPLFSGTVNLSTENVIPYNPLELEGRDIYIREGCNNCHTQTVRPLEFETKRYGSYSQLRCGAYYFHGGGSAMPARPRRELIDESRVGAYHCFTCCVGRSFLCGEDGTTDKDFSHRKDWVRERLEALASVFGVDVFDQAVLDNHLHVMLRNRPDVVRGWSVEEVVRRWLRLHLHQLELRPDPEPDRVAAVAKDARKVAEYRRRLSNISWFMKYLNEPIAVVANAEDGVTGHFWAERFGSVVLPDDPEAIFPVCANWRAA